MSPTIKICGLSEPATLDAALEAGVDMVGFVFFAPSPRHLSVERADALGARVAGRARKVALTVNADDTTLAEIVAALQPDMLQLHGAETPARVAQVRMHFGVPVMKALPLAGPDDVAHVAAYEDVADVLLFDAYAPEGTERPGGNGSAFDWALLNGRSFRRPWLLAGGLDPETVADAVRATGAPGVDVSSGVESAPGRKDAERIRRFVAAARTAR